MYFELSVDVILPPCAPGIVLQQEAFPQGYTVFKYAYHKLSGVNSLEVWTKTD